MTAIGKLVISSWFIVISLFIAPIASAQTSTGSAALTTGPSAIPVPATVSPTSPLYTDLLVHNLFHTFSCLAVGQSVIGQPCLNYIQGIPVLSSSVNTSGGVLGVTTDLIGALYLNPPVRTIDYLASVGEGLGIVKPAHAQVVGSGAQVLNPIVKLWQVSRNISYVVMIIIFVIIGLMVMFRQRINPQTVITAQAALPGLVIGLILITFSYFLAALISDMAFVGTNVVGYYFAAAQEKTNDPRITNLAGEISDKSVLNIFSDFTGAIDQGQITHAVEIVFNSMGANVQGFLRGFVGIMAFQFGAPFGHIVPKIGDIVSIATGFITSVTASLALAQTLGLVMNGIAIAIIIYAMLRLLLRLINTFLSIIFLTVTAPFHFLAASLPGRQGIATGWILNMLANILIFPAVLAVFYFVAFLLERSFGPLIVEGATQIVGNTAFPLFGGMDLEFIKFLLAFGALVALPAIPDIIVRSIGRVGQAGQLIGQELGGSTRAGQGYATQFQQRGLGAASYTAQQYQSFRGAEPTFAPAKAAGWRDWTIFGKKPFARRA